MRESPALDILALLQEKGADVLYHDPHVSSLEHEGFDLRSTDLADGLRQSDAVVVVTDHSDLDWDAVAGSDAVLVDTRSVLRSCPDAAE